MKTFPLLAFLLAFNANAQSVGPCEAPRPGLIAIISGLTVGDNGQTFCYAAVQATDKIYAVLDCGIHQEGETVIGTVRTYWTHKDDYGNPVCDYQNFIIENLPN